VIDSLITIFFLVTIVSSLSLKQRSEISESSNRESVGVRQGGLFGNFIDNLPGSLSGGQMPGSATNPAFQWEALDLILLGR